MCEATICIICEEPFIEGSNWCNNCTSNSRAAIEKLIEVRAENKALKTSRDDLLELAHGYLSYVNRNGDDFVSGDIMRIIENKILKAEALKEKEHQKK